jgi:Arc/MetJ-type ribon-helix-helix transcriptional regulator
MDPGKSIGMTKAAKIAISLPADLLQGVDRECEANGETRSEYFRRAVQALLRHEQELKAAEQYVRGYADDPEAGGELAWVETASLEVLATCPWGKATKE